MVTRRGKRIRHALEKVFAAVFDQRGLAMHHPIIDHDISAEDVTDALVAKANAQRGNARAEITNDLVRESRFSRRAAMGSAAHSQLAAAWKVRASTSK